MNRPNSLRFALVVLALVMAACGDSKKPASDGGDMPDEDSSVGPSPEGGARNDGGASGEGGVDDDAATEDAGGEDACRTECAAGDCGEVPRCGGGFLSCSACVAPQVCGQYALNKCGTPPPDECTPLSPTTACSGKCGAVSDGCSGVIQCDSGNGGQVCDTGEYCEGAACKASGATCTPQTCADNMHTCGIHGDGCGGVLDCTMAGGVPACDASERCAYAAIGSACEPLPDDEPTCTPLTRASACSDNCGTVGDGCGGTIDCEADPSTRCPTGETCGGGGVSGECGSSGQACIITPASVVCSGKCGSQPNGCGGVHVCNAGNGGQTCDALAGESCGGGGVPNVCGKVPCSPKSHTQACSVATGAEKSCGQQPDGCGGLVDCGGCASNQQCGLVNPSVCGTVPSCMPTPVATACAGKCGTVPDGCGGSYVCSASNGGVSCTGSEYCGANGTPNKCGAPIASCVPRTCAQLGHSCGLASDGCGQVLNCGGACTSSTAACLTNSSGSQSCVEGGPVCMGSLCSTTPSTCGSNSPTRLTGTVRTPGRLVSGSYVNQLPVPNAIVYIPADPTATLPSFVEGVNSTSASCGRCGDEKLVADGRSVLAAAVTDYKGNFTLEGRVPVGSAFNLVIKVGKWRRVVQVPAGIATSCASASLALDYTRLSASTSDGLIGTHLPKIAVSTGDVDAMECVLYGMGIARSEFTVPSGSGRIHMYRANGARMGTCAGNFTAGGVTSACSADDNFGCFNNRSGCSWTNRSVADTTIYANQAALNAYDVTVFDCEGGTNPGPTVHHVRSLAERQRIESYVNAGGRMFASHWSYEWLDGTGSLDLAAAWNSSQEIPSTGTGLISLPSGVTARPRANPIKSLVYRNWLDWQGALAGTTPGELNNPTTPQMNIADPRNNAGATVGATTDEWMYRSSNGVTVQQLSFNTPYGSAEDEVCGRVAFSAFHVATNASGGRLATSALYFPAECRTGELTAQEKTLAFMLFDLATCVSAGDPPMAPSCTPKTAADVCPGVNDACGYVSDGCGGVVDCAGCAAGFYCDGNICREQQCTPSTCTSLGFNCGDHADGCGGIARNAQGAEGCGTCSGGQTCGLTQPGICGGCTQIPFATACPPNSCGQVSNGCGGTHDCGTCPSGVCGGAGANRCGPSACTPIPQATACANKDCGLVADGCGGTYTCGTCTAPATCGGDGRPNRCGAPSCTKKTRDAACGVPGYDCGFVADGCGGVIECGTCPNNGVCGGGGTNKCGGSCTKTTCAAVGANCGTISDLCGSLLNCGMCPAGQTCGATMANRCGSGPACTPTTCGAQGAECGLIGDGCGGVLDCGSCTTPETCGGGGTANQCGTGMGGCNKRTCAMPAVQCGPATDGCGGVLDCGSCPSGQQCNDGVCAVIVI